MGTSARLINLKFQVCLFRIARPQTVVGCPGWGIYQLLDGQLCTLDKGTGVQEDTGVGQDPGGGGSFV